MSSTRFRFPPLCLLWNLFLVYAAFMLCRIVFWCVHLSYFPDLSPALLWDFFRGGLLFDTSAILYINSLYILLLLIPSPIRGKPHYARLTKVLYLLTNGLCILANLADIRYFPYTNRRTTATVFSEFGHEGNISAIIGREMLNGWYLILLFLLILFLLFYFYRQPAPSKGRVSWSYYPLHTMILLLSIPLVVFGMRGGIGSAVRPITISNANAYVNRPLETAIVLNTPFCLIRTIGKTTFKNPQYFTNEQELTALFNPERRPLPVPTDSLPARRNVVILIVESLAQEYIGALNQDTPQHTTQSNTRQPKTTGYTPFIDSLIGQSLTFTHSFGNGRKSIDGMPSVLSSIPMFVEPFFLTSASLNTVGGVAASLHETGYYSAFFHGAQNGSMGFEAFARSTGFHDYFGRTEYNADPRYNADADFDGTWAIWDEPFLQFYADKMSEFKQPFITALFTASSHHPFVIPKQYEGKFPKGTLPIHQCIGYTDHALRQFFTKASQQPWFKNTLFVLTADHTSQTDQAEYQTDLGSFRVPILFYAPGDASLRGRRPGIAQQIDVMPTVLSYLQHSRPYLAFGQDLLHNPDDETFAVNYLNGIYQYVKGDFLLQFDGQQTTALYNYTADPLLKQNILGKAARQGLMERELKAIIQQYMARMMEDRLTVDDKPSTRVDKTPAPQ